MTATVTAGGVAAPTAASRIRGLHTGRRILVTLGNVVLAVVVILAAWHFAVAGFHLDPFSSRKPIDVWHYLIAPENDAARAELREAFRLTARDAALGLFFGTAAGVFLALVFNRFRAVEQALMPIAMAFRAVPLVAMTPLIALIFHRGLVGVTVISGIVTFFPTLINVSIALRSVPSSSIDVLHAYGATKGTTLRKVQFPAALPAVFASIRIAAPLALVGALLAEWLVTGQGLGYLMLTAQYSSDYDLMWTAAAITTFTAVVLYGVVSAIEQVVLTRFSADPGR